MAQAREVTGAFLDSLKDEVPPKSLFNVFIVPQVENGKKNLGVYLATGQHCQEKIGYCWRHILQHLYASQHPICGRDFEYVDIPCRSFSEYRWEVFWPLLHGHL